MNIETESQSSSALTKIILVCIPVILIIGLVSLIWNGRQAGSSTLTEVGRVPKSVMQLYENGAVLPGSSDILLFGMDAKAGQLSGRRSGSLVLSLSNSRYKKLFTSDLHLGFPNASRFIGASITPDGKNILLSQRSGSTSLRLIRLIDGYEKWKSKCWADIQNAWRPFSSDGSIFLALRSDTPERELWVFDTRSGKPVRRVSKPISGNEILEGYGFISGTNRIIYIHRSPKTGRFLWSLDAVEETPRLVTKLQFGNISHVSPNGKMLAFEQEPIKKPWSKQIKPGYIGLLDNNGHNLRRLRTLDEDETTMSPRWSPDSKYIAVPIRAFQRKIPFIGKADRFFHVVVYDANTGSYKGRVRIPKQDVLVMDWYPDSKSLACIGEDEDEFIIYKLQLK